jgi:hypothetical protein
MNRILATVFCLAFLNVSVPFSSAVGCTIWAATGDEVQGKGSLIGKNRDNLSYLRTIPKMVFPENGFGFYGLFDTEANGYVTAGINEKGLVVVNAAANSVPREQRFVATEDLTYRLLSSFDSADAIILQKTIFEKSHPAIYIIADSSKIMSVEIAPAGKYSVTVLRKGNLVFTNHYTAPDLLSENKIASNGSLQRLQRARALLSVRALPFRLDDFIFISNDRNGGTEASIWRISSGSESIRTLASWIVHVPPEGHPSLYVRIANESEPETTRTIKIDQLFWKQEKSGGGADFRSNS